MSILASISIYKCDGCSTVRACQTVEEYSAFEASWYAGFGAHVCPACCLIAKGRQLIEADRNLQAMIEAAVNNAASKKEEVQSEYAN